MSNTAAGWWATYFAAGVVLAVVNERRGAPAAKAPGMVAAEFALLTTLWPVVLLLAFGLALLGRWLHRRRQDGGDMP